MPTINIFDTGGINQSLPHTRINRNDFVQLDNFMPSYEETNAGELVSFLQKAPSSTSYLDDLGSVTGRGMYQFANYGNTSLFTIYATNAGNLYYAGSSAWQLLWSSLASPYNHVEFTSYVRKETKDIVCAMTDGVSNMIKYNPSIPVATTRVARTSNVATLTVASHSLVVGDIVTVYGITGTGLTGLNATRVTVTAVSGTTLSYANTGTDIVIVDNTTGSILKCDIGYLQNKSASGQAGSLLTGVLTFTEGSATVSGSSTNFDPEVRVGDWIRVGDYEYVNDQYIAFYWRGRPVYKGTIGTYEATWFKVTARASDTSLTIDPVYTAETCSGGSGQSQRKSGILATAITFTYGSKSATGTADLSSTLEVGQYIRQNSTSKWYEIATISYVDPTTTLTLRETFKENTVTTAADTVETSVRLNTHRFVKLYDAQGIQKMLYACDITKSDYSKWCHSVPGDPEDVPVLNFDHLPSGATITGVGQIGNYLIMFAERSYYIYKYSADKDEFIRIATNNTIGCISSKTIREIPGGIIWLSLKGLYKHTISEGLKKMSDKAQLELDFVSAGLLNSAYYTSSQAKMPQAEIDQELGYYYLAYPLSEALNSYILVWDYINNKYYRWTSVYMSCMLLQRVSANITRLIYSNAQTTGDNYGKCYYISQQTTANSSLTSGIIKSGYWSFPNESGEITNKKIKNLVLKIMQSSTFNGTIALQYWSDWTTGSGTTITPTAWTNTTAYAVKHLVYPINQTCHHFQWKLSDTMTAGGYAIIGISLEYEDGSTKTYGSHNV